MNSYNYSYQHTCQKAWSSNILNAAPFKSKTKTVNGKKVLPFLGEGYYFWEENHKAAHNWGKVHYNNNYTIIEYIKCNIPKNTTLDFLDRVNLRYFSELLDEYTKILPSSKNWKLAQWIEFFKELDQKNPGLFPFQYLRAGEHKGDFKENSFVSELMHFTEHSSYYTYLNPQYIICSLHKNDLNCTSKNILH